MLLTECPRSYIRPETVTLLEEHQIWRMSGQGDVRSYPAKTVEAFSVLESERLQEGNHDK